MSRTSDRRYLRNRRRLQQTEDTCWLCGKWIDPDLKFPHPKSWSADHEIPVGRHGHNHGPLRAAHLDCNQRRGNRLTTEITPPRHARQW